MTHDERVYHHLYEDSKSPLENTERIASLEELVLDMWGWLLVPSVGGATLYDIAGRMRELGVIE